MKTLILLQIVIIDAWSNHLPCTTKLPLQPGDGRQRCLEHLIDGLKRNVNLQKTQRILQRAGSETQLNVGAHDARGRFSRSY